MGLFEAKVPVFGFQSPPPLRSKSATATATTSLGTASIPSTPSASSDSDSTNGSVGKLSDSEISQPQSSTAMPTADGFVGRVLDSGFRQIAFLVADYPKTILVLILLFTTVCSVKILFTEQEDDLKTGYTPNGARSHDEHAAYARFYDRVGGEPLAVVVFVTARDNGTMSRIGHLNATVELLDELGTKFKLDNQSFYDFCSDFCELNEPIRQFRNGLVMNAATLNDTSHPLAEFDDRIGLTFPFMEILGRTVDLSPNFFGVRTFSSDQTKEAAGSPTNIQFLKLVVLQFRADRPMSATQKQVQIWERSITDYVHKEYQNPLIQTMSLTVTLAKDEIVRTGMTLFPFISVGFLIMSVFSIVTVYASAFYYQQWTVHKITLAIWACVCPLLATSTALGFLFWFGFRFGTILAVTPFLVMAIGVDDAYLMIHSWQRIGAERQRRRDPLFVDSVRDRVAEMLVDVGPSITITSLTNVLAFTVGVFSPTPEIQLFCAGNATAIFFDYLYQILLFGPIVAIVGEFEMKPSRKPPPTLKAIKRQTKLKEKWLSNKFSAVFVLLVLCAYWIVSFHGMRTITPRITPKKLFLSDSIINDMNKLRDAYILPSYTAMSVFVNNAGDLSDPNRRKLITKMVEEFESLPNNLGAPFTHFWMRDYDKYTMSAIEDESEVDGETDEVMTQNKTTGYHRSEMEGFLTWPEYKHWNGFLRFDEKTGELRKFFIIFAFHGPELIAWENRGKLLNEWRRIVDKYAALDAFVWVDDAQFLDQIETLIPVTIQSSVATIICMAFVCYFFMSNVFTLTVATVAIMSICLGVFGFLSFWGIDLDPISMATTIMSIGFSVDFPAHVTYHYYRMGKESGGKLTPEERIYRALVAIGYPLIQCGVSTILFVTCLLFIDTYMSEVFVKTMFLVVSLGLIHALVLVPTMLCTFSRIHVMFSALSSNARHHLSALRRWVFGDGIVKVGPMNTSNAVGSER